MSDTGPEPSQLEDDVGPAPVTRAFGNGQVMRVQPLRRRAPGVNSPWALGLLTCLSASVPGCMTTAGLVAGPVSGPVSAIRHDGSCLELLLPVPWGMYFGFCRGLWKDIDFFTHGSYVAPQTLRVGYVFDPFAGIKGGLETIYEPIEVLPETDR